MRDKCFFDTNVLLYALKINDPNYDVANDLLLSGGVISVQTINEFTSVVRRKLKMPWPEVLETLRYFRELCSEPSRLPSGLLNGHSTLHSAGAITLRIR